MQTTRPTRARADVAHDCFVRQFRLPSPGRAVCEGLVLASLFIASGWMAGGIRLTDLLLPMVPVTIVMLGAMVASGIYRVEIGASAVNLCLHSAYGHVLAGAGALLVLAVVNPSLIDFEFNALFLFLSFFVLNTIRPLLSVDELSNGTGRRAR